MYNYLPLESTKRDASYKSNTMVNRATEKTKANFSWLFFAEHQELDTEPKPIINESDPVSPSYHSYSPPRERTSAFVHKEPEIVSPLKVFDHFQVNETSPPKEEPIFEEFRQTRIEPKKMRVTYDPFCSSGYG